MAVLLLCGGDIAVYWSSRLLQSGKLICGCVDCHGIEYRGKLLSRFVYCHEVEGIGKMLSGRVDCREMEGGG